MNYISFMIDILIYMYLVVYILYDIMHWTEDKTNTLSMTLAFVFITTVVITAVYYFFIRQV